MIAPQREHRGSSLILSDSLYGITPHSTPRGRVSVVVTILPLFSLTFLSLKF
nr:MAG TPA: hypothetical protein [Caudoviricetes sp.]